MVERVQQITDPTQSLESYLTTRDRYETLTPKQRYLIGRIDQEEPTLDLEGKLTALCYLDWVQTPDCVSIAHRLGEEEEEVEKRVNQIVHGSDGNPVLEATCRLIDHEPPKEKQTSLNPELRQAIIELRNQGKTNREIAKTLELKKWRLDYFIKALVGEGEIRPRVNRKKGGKE